LYHRYGPSSSFPSRHAALPISFAVLAVLGELLHGLDGFVGADTEVLGVPVAVVVLSEEVPSGGAHQGVHPVGVALLAHGHGQDRSEEHTSELQSRFALVCRLLL